MRTRSIRHRGRRWKEGVLEFDITSLLDILVIILVFLLKSYNSSGIVINVPKEITLPPSQSISLNTSGVNVQASEEIIYVDDKVVYRREEAKTPLDQMNIIYPVYDELVKKKSVIEQIQKTSPQAKSFSGVVNLVLDKTMRYSIMQRLMHSCAEAGFKTYKFVVLGEDN